MTRHLRPMAPAALALALTLTAGCTDSDATDQTSPAASDSAAAVATTLPHYVLTANLIPDVATDPQALWDAIGPLVSEAGLDGQVFGVQSVSDPSVQSAGADGAGSGAADEAGTGFSVGSDGSPQDQSGTVP